MNYRHLVLSLFSGLFVLSACGDPEDKEDTKEPTSVTTEPTTTEPTTTEPTTTEPTTTEPEVEFPDVDGDWEVACKNQINEEGNPESVRSLFHFSSESDTTGQFSYETQLFSGEDCAEPVFVIILGGPYTLGDELVGLEGAFELDVVLQTATLNPESEVIAGFLNEGDLFGGGFSGGVAKDVLGEDLFDDGLPLNAGDPLYAIVSVDGDEMRLGDDENGPPRQEGDRATELSEDVGIRQ